MIAAHDPIQELVYLGQGKIKFNIYDPLKMQYNVGFPIFYFMLVMYVMLSKRKIEVQKTVQNVKNAKV